MMNTHSWERRRLAGLLPSIIFAATLLLLSPGHASAAIPAPERLLPDDTLVVVTAPDFVKLRGIYKTSPQAQFWNDPAMKPFKDNFISKWKEEILEPLERDLGVKFDDYDELPQGQVTFALTQNGWDGGDSAKPAFLFLLDAKDKGDRLKKNLADLRKKWVEGGKPLKTEKVRDVEFAIFPLTDKDVPKTLKRFLTDENEFETETNKAPKNELIVGQFESMLIIGNSVKAVEKVMVHATGGAMPALGDLAGYDANRVSFFRDAPFYAWVNVKAFMDVLNRKPANKPDAADPFVPSNPEKFLTASGLSAVKTVAFSFQNSPDGSLFQVLVGVPESTRQGIFKLFPPEGKDSGPPPFVPADAVKFQRWRIDGQKTWTTLEKLMGEISPQWLSAVNFMLDTANTAAKQKDPDFDVRKNLIGNLGDDVITYEKAARGGIAGDGPALFLIGSPHPDQLAEALKSVLVFLGQQGGSPAEREFLGKKIYSVPLPAAMGPSGSSKSRSLSYAASAGYVAVSTDAAILEEYLRSSDSQQKTLRETAGLTEAIAKAGGASTGWFGYENQAETARVMFEALRKNAATNASGAALVPGGMDLPGAGNTFKEWMDFSLLPPFERISKYFYFNVYTGGANVDGLSFKVFTPLPPGLKK
jgi:hypothetical protein